MINPGVNSTDVGFTALGRMGRAIARNLLKSDIGVIVFDRMHRGGPGGDRADSGCKPWARPRHRCEGAQQGRSPLVGAGAGSRKGRRFVASGNEERF